MDRLKLVSGPTGSAVTVAEAKANQRIDYTDDDTLIAILLGAAIGEAERFLGRTLVDSTWDYYLDAFPADGKPIEVPLPPLISVSGVYYTDDAGDEQEFTTFNVDTAKEPGRIYITPSVSWPTPRKTPAAVRVRYSAGYVSESGSPLVSTGTVPPEIKAAILLTFGTLYEHRESIVVGAIPSMMPWGAEQLLRRHRVELGMA